MPDDLNARPLVAKRPVKRPGRHRTACIACRVARRKCDGGTPCGRCVYTGATCEPWGEKGSHVSRTPSPASGAETGATDGREGGASQVVRCPTSVVRSDSRSTEDGSITSIGASVDTYGVDGGESSGLMPTLGTGLSSPAHIPQGCDSISARPMRPIERGQCEVGQEVCTLRLPSVPVARVPLGQEDEFSVSLDKKRIRRDAGQERWASASSDKREEVQEGGIDAGIGIGQMRGEAGGCYVARPLDVTDKIEVGFELACRGLADLSVEGTLNITCSKFALKGLEFAFLVMGSGYRSPLFLRVLRECISVAEQVSKANPAPTSASDSAATAMALLANLTIADPPTLASGSEELVHEPSCSARSATPLRSHSHEANHPGPPVGHSGAPGIAPLTQQEGGGGTAAVAWINELLNDPQTAVCYTQLLEIERQPFMVIRTNAYMAQHFVSEGELALMCEQLKAHPPMLLSRFMPRTSAIVFFSIMKDNFCYNKCERTFYVEMINRRGKLVGCLTTVRWHSGSHHSCVAFRFAPLASLHTGFHTQDPISFAEEPTLAPSPCLNPVIAPAAISSALSSVIASMARDAADRCVIASVVPTSQYLPVKGAAQPVLPLSMHGQDAWPLLGPSRTPSPPRQAWQDLPTARLGGSGGEAEPLSLQGLQPTPPVAFAAHPAEAGPRFSTVAQAAAPLVAGSTWPSWAEVAVGDAALSGFTTSLVPCETASTLPQPSALLPMPDSTRGLSLDEDEMQLLLEAIGWSAGGEA